MEYPVAPEAMPELNLYPLGDTAVVLEFGDHISRLTQSYIQAYTAYLDQHPFPGFVEYVPAFTSITVYYNPWQVHQHEAQSPYQTVAAYLRNMRLHLKDSPEKPGTKTVEIPVCYGGKYGPDLEYVASLNSLKPKEVIKLHTQTTYLVYMIGFAPGFPYLSGMVPDIAAPRKDKPRAKVPAGSVGIAGRQTGVYPIQSPGGWQLIGRTPLQLLNPHRDQPSLLQAGDFVRFVAITEKQFEKKRVVVHGH